MPHKRPSRIARNNRSPFSVLTELRWNVFDDFSAFKTYFNLLALFVCALSIHLALLGSFSKAGAFLLCSTASLLPLGLWSYGKLRGLPIFPAYALTFFATFALQIYLQDELYDTRRYFPPDPDNAWRATWAVMLFLLPGTWFSYLLARKPIIPPAQCHVVNRSFANHLMLLMFIASSLVIAGLATEKFGFLGKFGSIMQAAARTGSVVSLFILAYQYGLGKLSGGQAMVVGLFLILSVIASMASLFLGGAISMMAVAIAGYALGNRKFPWLVLILIFPMLFVLHAGKGDMRAKYWGEARAVNTVGFFDYPSFFLEWFNFGIADFKKSPGQKLSETGSEQNLLERSSLIEIFITARSLAPDQVPYLMGETYRHIPLMLIPRFLYPDKPVAHAGQRKLNVHYKLQSEEAVVATYIAWGMMNEAFANFGYFGLPVVGTILALYFSSISRACSFVPLLSFRGLIGALTLGFAIQAEMASALWITSYVQSLVLLIALRWVVMNPDHNLTPQPNQPVTRRIRGGTPSVRRAAR